MHDAPRPLTTGPALPRTRRPVRTLSIALALALLVLTACGGAESADSTGSASEGGGEQAESGTLRLWHYEGANSAMGIAWEEAMRQFEQAHPGVTVEFEEKGFEQIQETASMVLNSDEAPDIMEYNKGNATAGLLSSQGLLTDLTPVVEERGWDDMLNPSLATTARYDERGIMGSGNWYGVPNYGEYVMVYYNQDMFDEHGVEVPNTLEELEAAMDTFVEAGVTPLALGATEYPAQQIWYTLALSQADRSFVDAYQLYEGDVDFHGSEMTFGAERMAEWVDRGYISQDATGINAEDMGVSFTNGTFPILISGSWWYGRFVDEISDFAWDSFLFPGNDLHLGSSGNLWVVPERSENKELAYDFIDITMQEDIQNLLGNSGGVPVAADPEAITDEKSQKLVDNFNAILDNDGLAFYPDWPAPGYYDVLVAEIQELIAGNKTPDEALDGMSGPYEENLATISG
jgi:raffinose/stachyose/melibiose transport system substrate-binding protein